MPWAKIPTSAGQDPLAGHFAHHPSSCDSRQQIAGNRFFGLFVVLFLHFLTLLDTHAHVQTQASLLSGAHRIPEHVLESIVFGQRSSVLRPYYTDTNVVY